MDIDFKKHQNVRDVVDRLLRNIADEDMDILRRYVQLEYPQLSSDNRRSLHSMIYSGRMAIVAVMISEERFRSKIRWGDLVTCLYEEVVLPSLSQPSQLIEVEKEPVSI